MLSLFRLIYIRVVLFCQPEIILLDFFFTCLRVYFQLTIKLQFITIISFEKISGVQVKNLLFQVYILLFVLQFNFLFFESFELLILLTRSSKLISKKWSMHLIAQKGTFEINELCISVNLFYFFLLFAYH